MKPDFRKAWAAEREGYFAEVFLNFDKGKLPLGEIRLYRSGPAAHLLSQPIGVWEIAMFAAGRHDLIDAWLETLIQKAKP